MATKKPKAAEPAEPMLRSAQIRGFSLLRDVSVEFGPGLTVITGASGAGKSLLFDAIAFALGGRAHRALLASGSSECSVSLELHFGEPIANRLGLPWKAASNSLNRSFSSSGRTKLSINGEAAKLADLEGLLRFCVELTGQFESQLLFNPAEHLHLVDAFGDESFAVVMEDYLGIFGEYSSCKSRLNALRTAAGNRIQEIEFLTYQTAELRKSAVQVGEKAEVEAELRLQQNAQQLAAAVMHASALLSGDDQQPGARDLGADTLRELQGMSRLLGDENEFTEAAMRLAGALNELEDIGAQCRSFASGLSHEPQREKQLSERLDEIHRLERKYACGADELDELLGTLGERLRILTEEQVSPEELERLIAVLLPRLIESGKRLSAARKKAAGLLERLSLECLRGLDFAEVQLEVNFNELADPGPEGLDQVELLISLNPGEPPRSLAQVASGGEASRILLALKAALAQRLPFGVMLLDEIEAGLGADSAAKVAAVLRELAQRRQVLAITHLPAVAAAGDKHLIVSKSVSAGRTSVDIARADEEARLSELMRMLGGNSSEAASLARRLLGA